MASRRSTVVLVGLLVAGACVGGRCAAAATEVVDTTVTMPQASLDDIDKKLNVIRQRQEELKRVPAQLEQVLKMQAQILEELEVVKVRASHAR